MILAETFAARAEQHLVPRGEPDYAAAVEDARHLCEALGVAVRPTPNAFTGERERVILAYGYAARITKALAGQRTRDLPRFVEGLCANFGLDVESVEYGPHEGTHGARRAQSQLTPGGARGAPCSSSWSISPMRAVGRAPRCWRAREADRTPLDHQLETAPA
jgi:hypothetical protein